MAHSFQIRYKLIEFTKERTALASILATFGAVSSNYIEEWYSDHEAMTEAEAYDGAREWFDRVLKHPTAEMLPDEKDKEFLKAEFHTVKLTFAHLVSGVVTCVGVFNDWGMVKERFEDKGPTPKIALGRLVEQVKATKQCVIS